MAGRRPPERAAKIDNEVFLERNDFLNTTLEDGQIMVAKRIGDQGETDELAPEIVQIGRQFRPFLTSKQRIASHRILISGIWNVTDEDPSARTRQTTWRPKFRQSGCDGMLTVVCL